MLELFLKALSAIAIAGLSSWITVTYPEINLDLRDGGNEKFLHMNV